ncbi:hypothetical protein [Streptomyces sp. G45]|uniref:hypothetical protein n=1 Tax=Streptomyces sp. G45 TaxID=3406627 RepID=UPI003C1E51B7
MRAPLRETPAQRRVGLGVAAACLIALTVALSRRESPADETAMWVSAVSAFVSVCAFAADLVRERGDAQAGGERRLRAAADLAAAVEAQWAAEARLRRLQDPGPLNVHWSRAAPPLADHRHNTWRGQPPPPVRDGDQRLDRIVATFREIPSRRLVVLGEPGAGKTVLAVRFVLGALADRRVGDPVPVLFPLAGWDPGPSACGTGSPSAWPPSTGRWPPSAALERWPANSSTRAWCCPCSTASTNCPPPPTATPCAASTPSWTNAFPCS